MAAPEVCRISWTSASSLCDSSFGSSSRSSSSTVAATSSLSWPNLGTPTLLPRLVADAAGSRAHVDWDRLRENVELLQLEGVVPELDSSHWLLGQPVGWEDLGLDLIALEPLPGWVSICLHRSCLVD